MAMTNFQATFLDSSSSLLGLQQRQLGSSVLVVRVEEDGALPGSREGVLEGCQAAISYEVTGEQALLARLDAENDEMASRLDASGLLAWTTTAQEMAAFLNAFVRENQRRFQKYDPIARTWNALGFPRLLQRLRQIQRDSQRAVEIYGAMYQQALGNEPESDRRQLDPERAWGKSLDGTQRDHNGPTDSAAMPFPSTGYEGVLP
jgi:hypothetical protein